MAASHVQGVGALFLVFLPLGCETWAVDTTKAVSRWLAFVLQGTLGLKREIEYNSGLARKSHCLSERWPWTIIGRWYCGQ